MVKINNNNYLYLCLISYVIGLFCTQLFSIEQSFLFLTIIAVITIFSCLIIQVKKIYFFNSIHCLIVALIIVSGFYYCHWRLPTVDSLDITHQLPLNQYQPENITVEGIILTNPRINQKQKAKFIFQAQQLLKENELPIEVTGKIYVTAPLLQATNLYPSMTIRLMGNLYQPQKSLNPGGFDFADYLSREGIFTGLSADSVNIINDGNQLDRILTFLRQRIVQTHVRYLKVPQGNLVSSMVIGSRAVDLDFELQNSFRICGLAHVLAASGFHVSILLGLLLYLTRNLASSRRLLVVTFILLIYASVAGFYPSILRACLMGEAVVIGMVYDRKVNVYGSLLLAGVILLLINPVWITDLGFQLSFLATLGLIVSLPAIVNRLDWFPPTIANLVAVPLAATIWVLPLQCYVFNYVPIYSILTNLIATPFVLVITIGGFISAFIGLFITLLGSAIAYILFIPLTILIWIVEISNNLPFSSLAVGQISLVQLLIVYFVFGLICISSKAQKYWYFIMTITLSAIVIPLIYQKLNLVKITVLNTSTTPTIMVQNQQQNTVINLGDKENIMFNIIPFLRYEGINNLNLVVENPEEENLEIDRLTQSIKVDRFITQGETNLNYLTKKEDNLLLEINQQKWLIVNNSNNNSLTNKDEIDVLVWLDKERDYEEIKKINPQTIIVNSVITNKKFIEYITTQNIKLFSVKNNALQWQPETGFKIYQN